MSFVASQVESLSMVFIGDVLLANAGTDLYSYRYDSLLGGCTFTHVCTDAPMAAIVPAVCN